MSDSTILYSEKNWNTGKWTAISARANDDQCKESLLLMFLCIPWTTNKSNPDCLMQGQNFMVWLKVGINGSVQRTPTAMLTYKFLCVDEAAET